MLIVTDTISSGSSLLPLTGALQKLGVKYDIATIGLNTPETDSQESIEQLLGGRIYYGQSGILATPNIYAQSQLSGTVKSDSDLFARPKKPFVDDPERFQEGLKSARQSAGALAEQLLEEYKKNLENSE